MPTTTVTVIIGFAVIAAVFALAAVHSAYSTDGPERHEHVGIWLMTALFGSSWLAPPGPHPLWALPTVIALAASLATTRAVLLRRTAA